MPVIITYMYVIIIAYLCYIVWVFLIDRTTFYMWYKRTCQWLKEFKLPKWKIVRVKD